LFSSNDIFNLTFRNIKKFGKKTVSNFLSVPCSYLFDLFVRYFRSMVSFSSWIYSSFFYSINKIIKMCSDKKMIGINAFSIVAFMTNAKFTRIFIFKKKPRNSMRFFCNSFVPKTSISIWIKRSFPIPTSGSFLYSFKESLDVLFFGFYSCHVYPKYRLFCG
jgi:hypothetical protein